MTALQRAAALLALVAAAVTPSDLAAQGGCGGACLPCQGAPSSAWKYGGLTGANFLAYCTPNSSCSPCNFTIRDRARVEAEALRLRLRNSSGGALDGLVSMHKGKLRTISARSAVVLLGGCDGATPVELSFLSPLKIDRLRMLGVPELGDVHVTQVAMAPSEET